MSLPAPYQIVHLARGRARNLAAHAALLDAASRCLFGRGYTPDLPRLAERLAAVAAAEHYPAAVSGFVRIELTPEGDERLTAAGVSLYDGYALRSVMPDAVTLHYDLPLTEAPTTAREAVEELAAAVARRRGAAVAVRVEADGTLRSADNAPLFGILGKRLIPAPAFPAVERELVLRAAPQAGLEIADERLDLALLPRLDELFYADHRGITSLGHCDSLPLMSLLAERLAAAIEALFPKM